MCFLNNKSLKTFYGGSSDYKYEPENKQDILHLKTVLHAQQLSSTTFKHHCQQSNMLH